MTNEGRRDKVTVKCVALIDDNRLYRNALRLMLETEGVEVGAEIDRIEDALADPARFGDVDLILLRVQREIRDYSAISRLRELVPGTKIVLLADRQLSPETLLAAMSSGVDGALLSELSPAAFLQSLGLVALGEKVVPAQLAILLIDRNLSNRLVPSEVRQIGLSERELEILVLLAGGCTNKAIAIELDLAEATVKVHVKSVLRKIHVSNRTQAAIWALGHGLATHDATSGSPRDRAPGIDGFLAAPDEAELLSGVREGSAAAHHIVE